MPLRRILLLSLAFGAVAPMLGGCEAPAGDEDCWGRRVTFETQTPPTLVMHVRNNGKWCPIALYKPYGAGSEYFRTARVTRPPTHGEVRTTLSDGRATVWYRPRPDYLGPDHFEAVFGGGGSVEGRVDVVVEPAK